MPLFPNFTAAENHAIFHGHSRNGTLMVQLF